MRMILPFLAAACSWAAPLPDFTGEWRLVNAKSQFANQTAPKYKIVQIDHRDPAFINTIDEESGQSKGRWTFFFSTDGVERQNDVLGNAMKSVTRWDGPTLVMKTSGKYGPNEIQLTDRYDLSPDGHTLTMKRHFEGKSPQGPMTAQDQILVHELVPLRAGIARVEITPKEFLPMYGYANRRCGPANGFHDPLMAKVLVLESALRKMAIVTLDLGSIVSDKLSRDVSEKLGIPLVLLAASHSHSTPMFLPSALTPTSALGAPPPVTAAYRAEMEAKVFSAIQQASQSMFEASFRAGRGSIQLGYNRLTPREHGRSRALFDNLERVPYGPLDPEFSVLEVNDTAGNTRALMVHYAVHAVVLGPTNCKYSADFPGAMQSTIEKALPQTQAMFVQGGAGDINPIFQGRSGDEKADFALVDRLGQLLAAEVLKTRSSLKLITAPTSGIHFKTELLSFNDRWDKNRKHEISIATALIGRDIAIAATPGEPLHKFQRDWKQQAAVPFAFYYGYTYSGAGAWPGYLPDLRSSAHGGYGADSPATRMEVGAGETILQHHLINLYQLRGYWLVSPGQN
ncbi:MAG: neutral/alkaline non-lysosomal ceramidase N-terminal domain-containing protein [Acidobacteria bacterium]|nr:neutral/alkaline non-lysosomal ceramidase N-terminal domain-containing protein [Acidobacteriota bacterium]